MPDKEKIYTFFSHEYGIIKTLYKGEKVQNKSKGKALDVWYLINVEISTKEEQTIHSMRNIHILWEFQDQNKSFPEIHHYLILLSTLWKKMPYWVPNRELFDVVETITKSNRISEALIILWNLKVIDILWEMPLKDRNITVQKILHFIHNNKIEKILRLSWIQEKEKEWLKNIIESYLS